MYPVRHTQPNSQFKMLPMLNDTENLKCLPLQRRISYREYTVSQNRTQFKQNKDKSSLFSILLFCKLS